MSRKCGKINHFKKRKKDWNHESNLPLFFLFCHMYTSSNGSRMELLDHCLHRKEVKPSIHSRPRSQDADDHCVVVDEQAAAATCLSTALPDSRAKCLCRSRT